MSVKGVHTGENQGGPSNKTVVTLKDAIKSSVYRAPVRKSQEYSLVVSVSHPRESADGGYDEGKVGYRTHHEDRIGLVVAVDPVANDLEEEPSNSRDGTSTVDTTKML